MPSIRGKTGCVNYCNMEREKKLPLENETASTTGHDNKVRRQGGEDLLEKKMASSMQLQKATKEAIRWTKTAHKT